MDANRWKNLLTVRESYDRGSSAADSGPLEAFFEVAARCNLHCQMCAINYDSRYLPGSSRPPFLTPELFRRLEPTFPTLLKSNLFGLGEPLLNKHLVRYVRELSSQGVEVSFNTNATLIDEPMAEALARAGAHTITVSIDGATAATYERIRVGGRHAAVLRGIRALVEAGRRFGRPIVDLSFVGMASNLHELPALVDLAAETGVRGIHVEPLYSQIQHDQQEHYARENLGLLGSDRVDEIFEEAKRRARESGIRLGSRFLCEAGAADYVERSRTADIWWTCSEPWTSIWVTSAGEVRTCCINETSFGNLFERSFEEIWKGEPYRRFREQHRSRRETPTGCGNCIRNGRVRHSPYLAPLEPVTYRPLRNPRVPTADQSDASASLEWPSEGAVVTDPLLVRGRIPRGGSPTVLIDRHFAIPLFNVGGRSGEDFAASLPVPYLTEGAHLLALRRDNDSAASERTVHVWRPDHPEHQIAATDEVGIGIYCSRPAKRARIQIDGRRWKRANWIPGEQDRGATGIALVDLRGLPPGSHRLSVRPAGNLETTREILRLPTSPLAA